MRRFSGLAALLSGCHAHSSVTTVPVAVVTFRVRISDDTDPPRYPAEVAPRYSNPLSFRVPGKVIKQGVRLGDRSCAAISSAPWSPRSWAASRSLLAPSRQRGLSIPVISQPTYLYNVFAAEVLGSWTVDFFGGSMLADRALLGQVRAQAYPS